MIEQQPEYVRRLCDVLRVRAKLAGHKTYYNAARMGLNLLDAGPDRMALQTLARMIKRAIDRLNAAEQEGGNHAFAGII